ncbi:MAG TPA: hypothetical protein VN222_15905 [Novosphingobium sp.]|nr:hypothetical protein [Novosphingobium sp.]
MTLASKGKTRTNGALSARRRIWQSPRLIALLLGATLGLNAPPALADRVKAAPEGPLITIKRGGYLCELPGTAMTATGLHQPDEDFTISIGSVYSTDHGRGQYLATGDQVLMTTGPKAGEKFHRVSDNFLRKIGPDGLDTELRCVRQVLNNQ